MSVQTTYSSNMTSGFSGQLYGTEGHDIIAMVNAEASASIAFGRAVMWGSTTDPTSAKLPTSESAVIAGIVVHSHRYSDDDLDTTGLKVGVVMNVLRRGKVWVTVEDAVVPGDNLWVRGVAGGDPEFLGGLLPADDSTDTVDCTACGTFLTPAAAGGLALLEVNFIGSMT